MSTPTALPPLVVEAAAHALAAEVRADLDAWADRWPIFDRKRFPAVALTTAVHLPELARPARALAALASLWIIAFDEVVDEERADEATIAQQVAAFKTMITPSATESRRVEIIQPATPMADDLAAALRTVVAGVAASPTFPAFAAVWRRSFCQMVDAIVAQHRLGRARAATLTNRERRVIVSYNAMLALTTESIGVHWYLLTGFILGEDEAVAQHAATLLPSVEQCARAVRLANDLRSWERDMAEGNVNTLVALEAELAAVDPGLPAERRRARALALLRARLAAAAARTVRLLATSPLAGRPALAGVARLLAFVTGVYARADYDTFAPEPAASSG